MRTRNFGSTDLRQTQSPKDAQRKKLLSAEKAQLWIKRSTLGTLSRNDCSRSTRVFTRSVE